MQIQNIEINKLNPAPYNPRKNLKKGDPEYDKLYNSIEAFGYVDPIIVNIRDNKNVVVGGHQRLKILQERGIEKVECSVVDLDDASEKALNIALNKISGEWSFPELADLLLELDSMNYDMDLTGFDSDELKQMMIWTPDGEASEDDFDAEGEAEAIVEPITKTGDKWILGNHRVMCGDSTKSEDVEKLMGGVKANLVITSPPYAEQRKDQYNSIPPDKYIEWFTPIAEIIKNILASDGGFFLNIKEHCENGERHLYVKKLVIALRENIKFMFVDELIWKHVGLPGGWNNRFRNDFEPVFHFAISNKIQFYPTSVGHWSDDIRQYHPTNESKGESGNITISGKTKSGIARPGNIIEITQNSESVDHPAVFPVGLPSWIMKAYSKQKDVVYDPFGGGGTTLIAAEQENRTANLMEIDPIYCDVIVKRWEKLTGKKAILEN